jgi:hypothetical protein
MRAPLFVTTMLVLLGGACIFAPNLEDAGYTSCAADAECAPGRLCESQLCVPPSWNDTAFEERRLLVVNNPAPVQIAAGSAVPVRIGGEAGVLQLTDVSPDLRITQHDRSGFRIVPTYVDRFEDRFVLWVPVPVAVPAGGSAALGYIEQRTAAGGITLLEQPAQVFTLFDDIDRQFDVARVFSQGDVVVDVASSTANVPDGGKLIWRQALRAPFDITFRARIEGATCSNVYLGVTASDNTTFATPALGFFVQENLRTSADVWVTADAQTPLATAAPVTATNRMSRFRIVFDERSFRMTIDDVVVDEQTDLRPNIDASVPLFATIDVDGACSITLDALWVTTLPVVSPVVVPQALVSL